MIACGLVAGCAPDARGPAGARPGSLLARRGDEIVVCGQLFHTGAPVVLWLDPAGYDAYRTELRFTRSEPAAEPATNPATRPVFFNRRVDSVAPEDWDLPRLQQTVDQFVLHYDAAGSARECFRILHDVRGLSVHFMLDTDGTIYQTLDLKERAWHATTSNSRSIGIEIANLGAYADPQALKTAPGQRVIHGSVQGESLYQPEFTPQQYDSLIKLTAALCTIFPKIRCDYPRDANGRLITTELPDTDLAAYQGILGHYHIQSNKTDPGPAMDWDRLIDGARKLAPPSHGFQP